MQQRASPVLRDSLTIRAQTRSLFIFFSQRSHTSGIQVIVDCVYVLSLHKAEPDDYISPSPDIEGRMACGILKVLPAVSTACCKYTADFFSPVLYTVLFLKRIPAACNLIVFPPPVSLVLRNRRPPHSSQCDGLSAAPAERIQTARSVVYRGTETKGPSLYRLIT